ncbi:MAG: hypothetical protein Q4B42_03070 [Oscillospiraceae bacterium]|nr:hypothetical protein [Oscillospiraceae bacterium]
MKLLKKLLIFAAPFLLLLALFIAFEPYDYWGLKGESRYYARSVSALRELLREQPENIVLGDSRMANFNADYIEEQTGERYTMLCYGGATLNESIEQFWFAAGHTGLKKVVFGLDFYTLNDNHRNETRFEDAREKALEPLKFLGNFDVWLDAAGNFEVAFSNVWADITGDETARLTVDDPSSLEQDVRPPDNYSAEGYRLDLLEYSYIIYSQCADYSPPLDYLAELEEIISYCEENGIELIFVIPNCSRVIWNEVIYPLELDYYIDIYKDFLKSRATVYDMEFDNDYAANDPLFYDGFHFVLEEKLHLARVIFAGEESEYCVRTTKEQYLAEKAAAEAEAEAA